MYVPEHFAERDRGRLCELMRRNSFATLISISGDTPVISHLPLLVEPDEGPDGYLYGHFARANSHWRALSGAANDLVFKSITVEEPRVGKRAGH